MSYTAAKRDIVYWHQRCIEAEAKVESLTFEKNNLKGNLSNRTSEVTYWRQRSILAEIKLAAYQPNNDADRRTANANLGARKRKRPHVE